MLATRIAEFDIWRPGYGGATVRVLRAGTTDSADVFIDPPCTIPIEAQQLLLTRVADGISYGRWAQPLYTLQSYELAIDTQDRTGVQSPPLTSLEGEDASKALAIAAGGTRAFALEDHLARRIDVNDFGAWDAVGVPGASAATNNATLVAAIGAAGALGGAYVEVPAGTYQISNVTLPQGVILRGTSRDGTSLQSTLAGKVVTIAGAGAGLSRLTLDGATLVADSVGLYAENKDRIVLDDVEIKRFDVGIDRRGGSLCAWNEVAVSNCNTGYRPHGDMALGAGGDLRFNTWRGGKVELCGTVGIDLRHVDAKCDHTTFADLMFDTNTGKAIWVRGARDTVLDACRWKDNTVNLAVEDADGDTVVGLEVTDGEMQGGTIELAGNLEQVVFRRMVFEDVAATITTPRHNVVVEDCRENGLTISGASTAWTRRRTADLGATAGVTTGNAPTKAWALTLEPGEIAYLEAKVLGRQRNGNQQAWYHVSAAAKRPVATLAYDTQTANFTLGDILTGATSGATARIVADSDGGTTGTLSLQDIDGEFIDDEIITDTMGGSATANGALVLSNVVLVDAVTSIRGASESDADWDATFVANGPQVELRVNGDTSQTVEWNCKVEVVRT